MEIEKEYACIILPATEWQYLKKTQARLRQMTRDPLKFFSDDTHQTVKKKAGLKTVDRNSGIVPKLALP